MPYVDVRFRMHIGRVPYVRRDIGLSAPDTKRAPCGVSPYGSMVRDSSATVVSGGSTERAAAIRWIQAQMADYGLTMEELEAGGFDPPPPPPPLSAPSVCYRNAEGLTWDGQGEMPSWLKRAVNAGQSVEFFGLGSA